MARVLQGTLNRSGRAYNLLDQICTEKQANIVIIRQQYRGREDSGWYSDEFGTAAIWIPDTRNFHIADHGSGSGFVWVRYKNTYYISVYLSPNDRIDNFQAKFESLKDAAREKSEELIVTRDFNEKASE